MCAQKIGRNDPCPCGSGKKYKRCCDGPDRAGAMPELGGLRQAMAGQDFASIDEARAFAETLVTQANETSRTDFSGLSPEQMSAVLYAPYDSPKRLRFADTLTAPPKAPIMLLFERLTDAIGTEGLKTTAKGNLPRAFCQAAAQAYGYGDGGERRSALMFGSVNKEEDFYDLHVTRVVAQSAGLIRKYKGRFLITRQCRAILDSDGHAGSYPHLFRAHATRFNWAYGDLHPELGFVQEAFAFSLYLLSRYGDTPRSQRFYEDAFLNAFPMLIDHVKPSPYASAEEQIRRCYTLRTLERFVDFFGLATLTSMTNDIIWREYQLVKTSLLDTVVQFDLNR